MQQILKKSVIPIILDPKWMKKHRPHGGKPFTYLFVELNATAYIWHSSL